MKTPFLLLVATVAVAISAGCATQGPNADGEISCTGAVPARAHASRVLIHTVDENFRNYSTREFISPGVHTIGLVSERNLREHRGKSRVMRWAINVKPGARYSICGVHLNAISEDFNVLVIYDTSRPDQEPVEVPTLDVLGKSAPGR